MALFATRGLVDYPRDNTNLEDNVWKVWLGTLCRETPRIRYYSLTANPTQVNANDGSTQTFTVTGLATNDIVFLNPSALEAGLILAWYRVSATDTLQVRFQNVTASNIDPASGTWHIVAITN